MLPKKQHISRKIFSTLGKSDISYHSTYLTLRVHIKRECYDETSKFSFVVSKKIISNASQRNLLKRRGYSIIKNIIKKTKMCFVCIFYFKKEVLLLKYPELEKEVISLLKKAHVILL